MSYRTIGISAAKKAGDYLAKHFATFHHGAIRFKGSHDIVTKADLGANRIILSTIKNKFPNHDFLSEETGLENNADTYRWIIDPLDGTTNFTIGSPLFCTALALVHKHEILLSIIYAPITDELFVAEAGHHTTLNGKRVHVSPTRQFQRSIITYGFGHSVNSRKGGITIAQRLHTRALNGRMLASGSLNLAYVAAGRVEGCVLTPPITLWDSIMGVFLVQRAGGKVTSIDGQPWSYTSTSVVASNRKIHNELLRAVNI